jgi:hypothetical protein
MSDKNPTDTYKKPESHQLGGDDLEEVAGETLPECSPGQTAEQGCGAGRHRVAGGCREGEITNHIPALPGISRVHLATKAG